MLLAGRSEISREFQIWYVARKSKLQRRNVCESRLRQTRYATSVTSAVTADYVAPSPSLLQVGADYKTGGLRVSVMSDLAGPVLGEVTLALRLAVGAKHKVACSHIHCYVRFARGIFDNRR